MVDQESLVSFSSETSQSINSDIDIESQQQPRQYIPSNEKDGNKERLHLTRTETVKSLQEMGMTQDAPIPDVNAPQTTTKNAIFPEEYTMETPTGLVPVATLQSLGRTSTAISKSRTRQIERSVSRRSQNIAASSNSSNKEELEDEEEVSSDMSNQQPELDPEIEFVTFVTGDPTNPHNWPLWIRWAYTVILSCLVICVAYGSACITGGLFTVQEQYHVGLEAAILSCSLMVIGFSLGPLIWSPVSDLYGRRLAYFISMGLYTIFNIPCALSPNLGGLLVCRFLCGVFSSSGLCLVGGSIADMFPSETRGRAIAFFAFAPYTGPIIGPLVNGFVSVCTRRMDLIFGSTWPSLVLCGSLSHSFLKHMLLLS